MYKVDTTWLFIPSTSGYKQKRARELSHRIDCDIVGGGQMTGCSPSVWEKDAHRAVCAEQGHWDDHGDLIYERKLKELGLFIPPKTKGDMAAFNKHWFKNMFCDRMPAVACL